MSKVLVSSCNSRYLKLVSSILTNEGYEVYGVEVSPYEKVSIKIYDDIEMKDISLILIDASTPDLETTMNVCEEVKKQNSQIEIIISFETHHTGRDFARAYLHEYGIIQKPFHKALLTAKVSERMKSQMSLVGL